MKTTELASTSVKTFNLTLHEGKAVVRNQKRVQGLIGVRYSMIPELYHGLLATATFIGNAVNESIVWSTDLFNTTPVRLSELEEDEYRRYKQVLTDAMQAYANALAGAEANVKQLLYCAVTYHSESSVYCADGRVVIVEWGMSPKGHPKMIGLPMSIDDFAKDKQLPPADIDESIDNFKSGTAVESEVWSDSGAASDSEPDPGLEPKSDLAPDSNPEPASKQEHDFEPKPELGPELKTGSRYSSSSSSKSNHGSNNNWWKILLLLLAALLLASLWPKSCSKTDVDPVTPELGEDDVVLSPDSLRYIAGNRLIIFLTADGADINEFVKDFRKKYSDPKKYILSNPDEIVKRVTLTLPTSEREDFEQRLPEEFEEYGVIVIPDSMYQNTYSASDPDFSDSDKRWYFEKCSVFDAWEQTMGADDIIVAVIDDGFDLTHPEFDGKVTSPYNAVTQNRTVTPSPSGHGTHVASTAVGNADNGSGMSGIAPKCKLMPIQVGDSYGRMPSSAVIDGVLYAINNGADVVNMSLGMSFGPFVQYAPLYVQKNFRANMFLQEEKIWEQIFDLAKHKNVTFVLAGGNENCLIGLDPMQRSVNTIKVSATQPDDQKASFSNYGDMSTVSAPGVRIFNAIPGSTYTYMDGTSMASPIVAGGCALLKSNDPYLTTADLARILKDTGIPSPSDVGPIVNFAKALNVGFQKTDECSDVNKRYHELLAELEELKRKHPNCIQTPDTLQIPKNPTLDNLYGRWKSTTSLYNHQEESVVLYFTFNGTSQGVLDIAEPDGEVFSATLAVTINGEQVEIDQLYPATSSSSNVKYNPYRFVLKPDRDRKAQGNAKNKVEKSNVFNFNLVQI
ncbi:MAG: S8 family serine peptidase [Bacteroidales bacterium]|nr:S8 family serine peptidase [Bacteroidales bacterium]